MPELVPIDHDPYAVELTPVDHDPVFDTAVSGTDPALAPFIQQTPEGYPYYQGQPQQPAAPEIGPPTPIAPQVPASRWGGLIDKYFSGAGLDPVVATRIMQLESGGDPYNRTGSYKGLFQLSDDEFRNNGGTGSIFDPEANTRAAANKIAAEADRFRQIYGREPTPTDIYLTHNQGEAGYGTHLANPDVPAWQNMLSTAEGRQKGAGWARAAVWKNVPDDLKPMFPGGVDTVTSQDFVNLWRSKVEGNAPPSSAFEAAAARVRRRYPTREPDPASLAASQGAVGWGDVAQGMGEMFTTPGRAYRQGLTPEEEVQWGAGTALGMIGGGTPFAEPGAAGIFGGKLAKTANIPMLKRAQTMHAAGVPPERIWSQTGWFQGADAQWRFWIPDLEAKTRIGFGAGPEQPLTHPGLMEAYPQLKDYTLNIEAGPQEAGLMMKPGETTPGYIEAAGPTEDVRTSTALHELQHGVQDIEGFTPGGAPGQGLSPRVQTNIAKSVAQRLGMDWDKLNLAKQQEIKKYALHEIYRRIAGETEARNVQEWQHYRPGFEGQRPPWTTEEYPRSEQIMARPGGRGYGPVILRSEPPPSLQEFRDMAAQGRLRMAGEKGELKPSAAALRKATSPVEYGRLYGYSEPDIAHFYLQRRGGFAEAAHQEYLRDLADAKVPPVNIQRYEPVEHDPFALEDHPGMISTRYPTAVKATEDPLRTRLSIDTSAMKQDYDLFKHNTYLVRGYPNLTKIEVKGTPEQVAENFIEHVKNNLLWLHDQVPPEIRDRSKLWYKGANRIVNARAQQFDLPDSSVAGVYAAMSPQKDWFQNVSLGDRVMDIYFNKRNEPFSKEMLARAKIAPKGKSKYTGEPTKSLAEKYPEDLRRIKGKTFAELDGINNPEDRSFAKAMWLRLYDEAHNSPNHYIVTPEGELSGLAQTGKGQPKKVAWGSLTEIEKAIGSIEARGNVDTISGLMGMKHKVRNFYNNMLHPDALTGDVTIDTHAVAAGLLRPLGGNALEVSHNFGNYAGAGKPGSKSSAVTGVEGTYGLYADAYRRAAAERGLLPREMQSITWEAARGLFTDAFKRSKPDIAAIEQLWKNYRNGKITIDQVREQVYDRAGGIKPPDWHQP